MKYYNIIGPQVRRLRYARQWSQSKLAAKLQCAGWDISRSNVSKLEARLKFVLDFELDYLVEVLRVELKELLPKSRAKSQVSKIECRLVHVSDFQQLYFARIFKVSLSDLFPNVDPNEKIGDFLTRAMERKRTPIPRGKRRKTPNGKNRSKRKISGSQPPL